MRTTNPAVPRGPLPKVTSSSLERLTRNQRHNFIWPRALLISRSAPHIDTDSAHMPNTSTRIGATPGAAAPDAGICGCLRRSNTCRRPRTAASRPETTRSTKRCLRRAGVPPKAAAATAACPSSNRHWLPQSASECTASAAMEPEPVISAVTSWSGRSRSWRPAPAGSRAVNAAVRWTLVSSCVARKFSDTAWAKIRDLSAGRPTRPAAPFIARAMTSSIFPLPPLPRGANQRKTWAMPAGSSLALLLCETARAHEGVVVAVTRDTHAA